MLVTRGTGVSTCVENRHGSGDPYHKNRTDLLRPSVLGWVVFSLLMCAGLAPAQVPAVPGAPALPAAPAVP
ncbi:MAG: hypothetical protein JWO38_5463, partial [Gemmataceae bacterium]|nr:hypothetical protein [Gemmataceae bacterium]